MRWYSSRYYDDDYDPCCPQCGSYPCFCDSEAMEREADDRERTRLRGLTPEELGKEWSRHCRRHDRAVDRCEQINSPTIEDAAGWMRFIKKEFESRGLSYFDYTGDDNGEG